MSKFEQLTKYIDALDGDGFGTWIVDHENNGTPEHPIQMLFVNYSEMVHKPKNGYPADMANFVEMCFDPKSPMNAKLKQTLVQLLGEVDDE